MQVSFSIFYSLDLKQRMRNSAEQQENKQQTAVPALKNQMETRHLLQEALCLVVWLMGIGDDSATPNENTGNLFQ